jgi:putative endonuclease
MVFLRGHHELPGGMMKNFNVYIMASKRHGTLYVGVTSDLVRRVYEHKTDALEGFTKKYGVHSLVYYESTEDVETAIQREKQLKNWQRAWKTALIERSNPDWRDLYEDLTR